MKICIIGAGAIGGLIGTKVAVAGQAEVSVVARGDTLAALRRHGLRLKTEGKLLQAPVRVEERPADLGTQDVVIIAVKAPSLPSVASQVAPLIGPSTIIVPAMNGVPWWFVHAVPALGNLPLAAVDPSGLISSAIPAAQVLGCVVHASASMSGPGIVDHKFGRGLIIGEPLGGESERARDLGELLKHAGFDATVSSNVRQEIWYKLWGNLTMNPVSAITGVTVDCILGDDLVREFCSAAMREVAVIGAHIGCSIEQSPEDRHDVTRKLGAFRTSMLQDVEAGREIELDAIVGAVHEIARRLNVPAPNIDALLGLTRLFGRGRGVYSGGH
ncbi:MAG: 2-dehydropantoate 2-reductase [Devosia sp.]